MTPVEPSVALDGSHGSVRALSSATLEVEDVIHESVPLVRADRSDSVLSSASSGRFTPTDEAQSLQLTFLHGLSIVVSLQIGSGIFSAPTLVSQHVSSPGLGLLVWLVGGLIVWAGAASFIELGLQIPHNGGMQEYLRVCYGDFSGFLFTWTWVTIGKPASIAIIATVFAEHFCRALLPAILTSAVTVKLVALFGVLFITMLNCLGAKAGPTLANGFLIMKIAAVVSIVLVATVAMATDLASGTSKSPKGWLGTSKEYSYSDFWTWLGNYVTAIFGALYCYGGWETIGFILGDVSDPQRNLPRILNSAMALVVVSFLLINGALYLCLPFDELRTSGTPVIEFGRQVMGPAGGIIYSLVISASALGSMNANVFATGVLCVAASKRSFLPSILSNNHCRSSDVEVSFYQRYTSRLPHCAKSIIIRVVRSSATLRWDKGVPVYALVMNAGICAIYIVLGTFNGLITFVGITEYIFLFFSVLGLFVLRAHRGSKSHKPATYRTWTGNPIIFCAASGVLVIRGAISDYFQGIAILAIVLIGWIVFRLRTQGLIKTSDSATFLDP